MLAPLPERCFNTRAQGKRLMGPVTRRVGVPLPDLISPRIAGGRRKLVLSPFLCVLLVFPRLLPLSLHSRHRA
jgi:hypothetical protein